MPWKSEAQRRWGNSPSGEKALGKAGVHEWDEATKGKSLPEKIGGGAKVSSEHKANSTKHGGEHYSQHDHEALKRAGHPGHQGGY